MAKTSKISVAIGTDELRLARAAATDDGVSLSAFITRAVRERLEERARAAAARRLVRSFEPDNLPSPEERRALINLWTRAPRERAGRRARRKRVAGRAVLRDPA